MTVRSLTTRTRRNPARRYEEDSWFFPTRGLDQIFGDFWSDIGRSPLRLVDERRMPAFNPRINVVETDNAIKVTAELPGLNEKDVSIELEEDLVTIAGSKPEDKQDKEEKWHYAERTHGDFKRVIRLASPVAADKTKAVFKNGLLSVYLPKQEEEKPRKTKIAVKTD